MKETIQLIKTDGSVLFEHTQQDNSIIKTLNEFIFVQNHKDLSNIDLSNQNLEDLDFYKIDFTNANFKSANLKNVTFDFANLLRANFSNVRMVNSSFRYAYLSIANLDNTNLRNADLYAANLMEADLTGANLSVANLRDADLTGANLSAANLRDANLNAANLDNTNLRGANLIGADLRGANLSATNLMEADLRGANLYAANLVDADLRDVIINEKTRFFALQCPSEGAFIGWKKAGTKIVKLLIPKDAKRSSSTTLKCRCSKAKVLDIQNLDGSKYCSSQVSSDFNSKFIYEVGKTVKVPDFDEDRWEECSSGIHFFISREIAKIY